MPVTLGGVLDCETNSPCQLLRKCIENSIENIYIYVRVWKIKGHETPKWLVIQLMAFT